MAKHVSVEVMLAGSNEAILFSADPSHAERVAKSMADPFG